MPLTSGLRGWGILPGNPAGFLGSSGQGKCPPLLSCSSGPGPEVPSHLPVLISLASILCPQDPPGLEGALEGMGWAWELRKLPEPDWVGQPAGEPGRLPRLIGWGKCWAHSLLIQAPKGPSRCGNPSPLSTTPQGRQSFLTSPSPLLSVPPCPTSLLQGSSHLLGRWGPPPASSRHPSGGEMRALHLPTLPS